MEERGVHVNLVDEHEMVGYEEAATWVEADCPQPKYNLPRDHGLHTHTCFTTYREHLRNADPSLDNAEVRALASRYGNPDRLLAED